MSNDGDLMRLYSARIMALAADLPHSGRLPPPALTATHRSPLCGSTVTVDLVMQDGRIVKYAQQVKACALGQAAASIVGHAIIGRSRGEVDLARDELRAMLRQQGPVPSAPFDALEVLTPARDYKNRHASILLTLEAISDVLAQTGDAPLPGTQPIA